MIESNIERNEVINLITKRQLLTVASVAVVFFLLGSMLIGGLIAMGKGRDKDEDLWNAISELESRVGALEEQALPSGFLSVPAYDSGWFSMQPSHPIVLEHNLNTTEVFVYLIGSSEQYGVHQNNFGGNSVENYGWRGGVWHGLNTTHITITRHGHDSSALIQWAYVRVMIWKILETAD